MTPVRVLCDGDPVTPEAALREIRAWLTRQIDSGLKETRGYENNSGHPHYWTAVLIPDWDVKQKLALVDDALSQAISKAEGAQ